MLAAVTPSAVTSTVIRASRGGNRSSSPVRRTSEGAAIQAPMRAAMASAGSLRRVPAGLHGAHHRNGENEDRYLTEVPVGPPGSPRPGPARAPDATAGRFVVVQDAAHAEDGPGINRPSEVTRGPQARERVVEARCRERPRAGREGRHLTPHSEVPDEDPAAGNPNGPVHRIRVSRGGWRHQSEERQEWVKLEGRVHRVRQAEPEGGVQNGNSPSKRARACSTTLAMMFGLPPHPSSSQSSSR